MSQVTPAGAGSQMADQVSGYSASERARIDRQENEESRADQAQRRRHQDEARTQRQQDEAPAQERAEQTQRREATQEAQNRENSRGQNLAIEQEQGRGQAVDTVA